MTTGIISALIATLSLLAVMYLTKSNRDSNIRRREMMVAETYAVELMEFLVSHSSDRFQARTLSAPLNTALLCTFINQRNRANNTVTNPVPFADLPQNNILEQAGFPANRYFKVDIVDVRTRAVRNDVCALRPGQVQLPGRAVAGTTLNLNQGETFRFTVGVEWKSRVKALTSPIRLEVASTSQNL
jgi:hypothetical protein